MSARSALRLTNSAGIAALAPRRELQERLDAGATECNREMFGMAALGGDARCACDIKVRQASEILLVQQHEPALFVRQHILAELRSKRRQPLGDRRQSRLGLSRGAGAGTGEIEMIALKHARLFGGKPEVVLLAFKRIDALEQGLVQRDLASMAREHRRDLPLDRLELVI